MSDYWESLRKAENFADFMDTWHGCWACACDHGCNGWMLENSAKAYRIFQAVAKGATAAELDVIVQTSATEIKSELRKEMWNK